MFDYFNPYRIFKINSTLQKIVFFCFVLVLSAGLLEALFLSPEDYLQKDSVRIMYVHVPAAWICLGIFSLITFLSTIGYIFRIRNFFFDFKKFSTIRFCIKYNCTCNWIYLGKTNLGNLVGLGCKNNFYVNPDTILYYLFNCMENL